MSNKEIFDLSELNKVRARRGSVDAVLKRKLDLLMTLDKSKIVRIEASEIKPLTVRWKLSAMRQAHPEYASVRLAIRDKVSFLFHDQGTENPPTTAP